MKKSRGITIISLVVTIIILLILAGVSVQTGSNIIKRSQLENMKTNMLLIRVKGKEYVEVANFDLGTKIDEISDEDKSARVEKAKTELIGEDVTSSISSYGNIGINTEDDSEFVYYYKLSTQDLSDMGLSNVNSNDDDGWFIIEYDVKDINVEVYNTKGFENDGSNYYSLNSIQNLEL